MDASHAPDDQTLSEVQTDRDAPVRAERSGGERAVLGTRLLFLLVLTVVAIGYTVMAFDMEWRLRNGQIGPGFFPRIVGVLTVIGLLAEIARVLLAGAGSSSSASIADADEDAELGIEGDGRTDAPITAAVVGAMGLCYMVFEPLGALLASILFLALVLSMINRGNHRQNALVSILVPVGLYVLFEVLLGSGLPPGLVLPPL